MALILTLAAIAACEKPSASPAQPPSPQVQAPQQAQPEISTVASAGNDSVEAAIGVIKVLDRPGRDNLATVWDGNKYVQCRRMSDRSLRCEAAGALMQTSMARVLTPDRVGRLAAQGWKLDPNFGNYVQSFKADIPAKAVADNIRTTLVDAYGANLGNLEVSTKSIRSQPCPPRNGPSQNLAGVDQRCTLHGGYGDPCLRLQAQGGTAGEVAGLWRHSEGFDRRLWAARDHRDTALAD
jgi:hypothetical protein